MHWFFLGSDTHQSYKRAKLHMSVESILRKSDRWISTKCTRARKLSIFWSPYDWNQSQNSYTVSASKGQNMCEFTSSL